MNGTQTHSLNDVLARLEQRRRERNVERAKCEAERLAVLKRVADLNTEDERDELVRDQIRKMFPESFCVGDESQPRPKMGIVRMPVGAGKTTTALVLDILKDAPPEGMTAKQIKAKADLKYKVRLNSNTLTVTLVRYSKLPVPLAKCEGRVWHYLPSTINGIGAHEAEKGKSPEVTGLL